MENINRQKLIQSSVAIVVISLFTFMAYYPSFAVPFVFDDIAQIRGIEHDAPWTAARFLGRRSMPHLSFDLNVWTHDLTVLGFHIVNLLLHIVSALAIFFLLWQLIAHEYKDRSVAIARWRISSGYLAAIGAAVFFAVHPLQVQAVTYIVQRITLMAAMFYFLSLLGYVQFRLSGRKWWAAGSLLCMILAMHSKETAVTLPLSILIFEIFFFSRSITAWRPRLIMLLPWLLGLVIIPASMFGVTQYIVGESQSAASDIITLEKLQGLSTQTPSLARWDYFITQLNVLRSYLRIIVVPVGQNVDHDFPIVTTVWEAPTIFSIAVIVAVLGGSFLLFKRGQKIAGTGILFFFVALLPESSFFPLGEIFVEYRLYLPMLGISMLIASLTNTVLRYQQLKWQREAAIGLGILLLVGSTILTNTRNQLWQDPVRLWSDSVAKSPHKARPYNNLGVSYVLAGQVERGVEAYHTAIELNPNYPDAHNNLGSAYGQLKKYEQATNHFKRAIEIEPFFVTAHNNLGVAYFRTGIYDEAEKSYLQAIEINPDYSSSYINLGRLYTTQKRYKDAKVQYERALALNPDQAEVYNDLAVIYWQEGDIRRAREALDQALRLDPDHAAAQKNLQVLTNPRGGLQLLR